MRCVLAHRNYEWGRVLRKRSLLERRIWCAPARRAKGDGTEIVVGTGERCQAAPLGNTTMCRTTRGGDIITRSNRKQEWWSGRALGQAWNLGHPKGMMAEVLVRT